MNHEFLEYITNVYQVEREPKELSDTLNVGVRVFF